MDLGLFKIGGTWTKAFLKLEDKWRVGFFKIKGAKYIYVYIYIYIYIDIYIYIYNIQYNPGKNTAHRCTRRCPDARIVNLLLLNLAD